MQLIVPLCSVLIAGLH
uniref:Uncharacterized protein n=1 Tax=Anguilla anguilla TaxID=7936 RepID=A0A0E9PKB5_ANGAN